MREHGLSRKEMRAIGRYAIPKESDALRKLMESDEKFSPPD
jgi:hypothetical protein